jgi:hypothetical protein
LLQIARMTAPEGDAAWLDNDDVLDEEEPPPTLRVPHYASAAIGEVVSDPPRPRSSLLLRAPLVLCAAAIVFELGWCDGSRLLPGTETSQAATKMAPMRIELHKTPRTIAPEEPQPQAPAQKPAPKFFDFLVPAAPTATKPAVYTPEGI